MATYSTEDIRNIALVGHASAGKTTLTEALLHAAGAIGSMGSVEKGNTVSDFDPQEKKHQHSLDTAVCHFDHQGVHVNLLDTPGYPDFMGRAISVLPAVDTVGVVVNAQAGPEMVTQRMMEAATEDRLCRFIIVNKIDAENVDLAGVTQRLRDTFGAECLPINLPSPDGSSVVDCFFTPSGGDTAFSSVEEAHSQIIDQVVEVDEKLMELYLEQGEELSAEQLHDPFEVALREGHLIPVCFVSAHTGAGIPELLELIARLMPNPLEGNPQPFLKGEGASAKLIEVRPDPDKHVVAHVFKISIDPFVGRISLFRMHQGTVSPNSQLFIGHGRKPFKVGHLLRVQGKEQSEMNLAIPGDICAVTKVDDIHFDAVLHDSHDEDHHHLQSMHCPPALFGLAIEPARRGDEQKLSDALHKLTAEDPCLRVEHNAAANETVLRGMGDLHLRALLERMEEQYHVEVSTHAPTIPYRETIAAPAEGHHRHKKQTGGAGQFGEVYLRVEPLERGAGFEFVDAVVGGVIPSQFMPAVEKGVRQVLETGAVAGFPLQDLKVAVYDGKYHPVDSKEVAFVAAGKKALLDAIGKARPIILEPIVNIQITVPGEAIGNITGDLFAKRGRVSGTDTLSNGQAVISAQVPLAELEGYPSTLKSLTGGEGTYNLEFSHYEAVPGNIQQDLIKAYRPEADTE